MYAYWPSHAHLTCKPELRKYWYCYINVIYVMSFQLLGLKTNHNRCTSFWFWFYSGDNKSRTCAVRSFCKTNWFCVIGQLGEVEELAVSISRWPAPCPDTHRWSSFRPESPRWSISSRFLRCGSTARRQRHRKHSEAKPTTSTTASWVTPSSYRRPLDCVCAETAVPRKPSRRSGQSERR